MCPKKTRNERIIIIREKVKVVEERGKGEFPQPRFSEQIILLCSMSGPCGNRHVASLVDQGWVSYTWTYVSTFVPKTNACLSLMMSFCIKISLGIIFLFLRVMLSALSLTVGVFSPY